MRPTVCLQNNKKDNTQTFKDNTQAFYRVFAQIVKPSESSLKLSRPQNLSKPDTDTGPSLSPTTFIRLRLQTAAKLCPAA